MSCVSYRKGLIRDYKFKVFFKGDETNYSKLPNPFCHCKTEIKEPKKCRKAEISFYIFTLP